MELRPTNWVLRDFRLPHKLGKYLLKLEAIIDAVAEKVPLEPKHRARRLQGDMKGLCECHIEPD